TGRPMLPATTVRAPLALHIEPAIIVTVLLPFEPVMATTRERASFARANNSTSPTTGKPRSSACLTCDSRSATPGLIATSSIPSKLDARKGPASRRTSGSSAASRAPLGGSVRESATRTRAPCRTSQRAMDRPVAPRPSTSTFLPFSPQALIAAPTVTVPFALSCSPQLQSGQADEDQHHCDDPEPDHHLIFFPAFELVVVVQRRHAKDPPPG